MDVANKYCRGFTLIEIIIVIVILGIISAVAVPRIGNMITTSRIVATKNELSILKQAIVGEDINVGGRIISQGYKGDLGYRPAKLEDLVIKPAGDPAYNQFTRMGWNGPYLSDDGSQSYKYDAWERAYILADSIITSLGPDRIVGTSDDIVIKY
jgi:general secretion pathway protein G